MIWFALALALASNVGGAQAPAAQTTPPPAEVACKAFEACRNTHPRAITMCIRNALFDSKLLSKKIPVEHAKDLGKLLRREGFVDLEPQFENFSDLPEGAVLVLDAHDPIKDKKPHCPKVYGNALIKCSGAWLDTGKNALDFHMGRGCRTKGIWAAPETVPRTEEDKP